jgi:hypothetical protein
MVRMGIEVRLVQQELTERLVPRGFKARLVYLAIQAKMVRMVSLGLRVSKD